MKIKYEITKDDYLKFNMYHLETSKGVKKELLIHRVIIPILLVAAAFAFTVLTGIGIVFSLPIFLIAAIAWAVYYPKFYKKNAMKNLDKMFSRGLQSASASKYVLNVKDEGIFASSQAGQTLHKWSDIVRFYETDEHIFLYVTDKIAHVIPKRCFKNHEEETEFMDIIKEHLN